MSDTTHSFRMNLARLWLVAGAAHALLFALIVGAILLVGWEVDWIATASITIVPAVFWVVYGLKFRLTVSPRGLHWMTLEGVQMFAEWNQIVRAMRLRFRVLPLVRIRLRNGDVSLVPLYLNDPAGFADALGEVVGPDHPLTRDRPRIRFQFVNRSPVRID